MVPRQLRPSSDPLEAARAALQELRAADDWNEPTPVVHVHVPPAAVAPATARRTPPAPAPQPWWRDVLQLAGRMPAWGLTVVFLALIAAWVVLALNGKAPVP